jgi:hypothetical protein
MDKEEKRLYDKEYRQRNKEKEKLRHQEYYQNNKEKILLICKKYRNNNRKKINERRDNKKKININFKITCGLRGRIAKAIKGNYKSGSAVKDLGCSIPELKTYLESKFQEGMTWENWGIHGWHIDHITPLDSFNLQNREEFLKACHYTNLQPLWAEENLTKGASPSFPSYPSASKRNEPHHKRNSSPLPYAYGMRRSRC